MAQAESGPAETRTDEVTRILREEVLTGRYRPGDRLPSERDLAERFGTTRGIVRVAIKKLEQLGLATVQPGGARVAPVEEASLDVVKHLLALQEPPDPRLVDQVFEVVGAMIATSARIAVERGSDAALERAREILAELIDESLSPEASSAKVFQLGTVFLDASDNLVLQIIRRGLLAQLPPLPLAAPFEPVPAKAKPLRRKLDRAIAARDADAAHDAVFALWSDFRRRTIATLTRDD